MHKQTKACNISQKVKAKVWERDLHKCVLCESHLAMPNAHYIARSHGGLGVEENIITLCLRCHDEFDNSPKRPIIKEQIKAYLKSKYPDWDESKLTYAKYGT